MNKQKQKQTHSYREQTVGCQMGVGSWGEKVKRLEVKICNHKIVMGMQSVI